MSALTETGKRIQAAAIGEDFSTNPKRGNILIPAPASTDLLRRVAETGCAVTTLNINANADAASNSSAAPAPAVGSKAGDADSSSGSCGSSSCMTLTSNEWALLRSFLVVRVKNVLEVATHTLRRQQDNVDDKTTDVYKQQLAVLNDFVLDNETILGELASWPSPMFSVQRLCEILLDPLRFNTSAPAGGDAFRSDATREQVVGALANVLRTDKLQAALRRCVLVAPSQINIGESCM